MGKMIRRGGRGLFLVALCLTGFNLLGRTVPDAADPVGFFTTVADKLLRSTFSFGVTNIPVCSNGVYVYSPAVQRLLQLSANVCDAANTNDFPVVFRPCFSGDTNGNLYITGYTNVVSVTGGADPQLALPLAPNEALPVGGTNVFINVYGVPWIIGAKKGLPGFNQFSMVNAAQFTRKLQIARNNLDLLAATYVTNQMYTMSISNRVGLSYWNAYNADYPRPVVIYARDTLYMALSNSTAGLGIARFNINGAIVNSWPGSQWDGVAPNTTPQDAAFVRANWTTNYLNDSVCYFAAGGLSPQLSFPTLSWTAPDLSPFPQVTLLITNYLQTFILDGGHVIDYVQLCGPTSSARLDEVLADPNFPDPNNTTYSQWSTNAFYAGSVAPTYGVMNQLTVSANPVLAPAYGGRWTRPSGMPAMLPSTPEAESAFYKGFFVPNFNVPGDPNVYVNQEYTIQAPYTPTRTVFSAYLLQANDPLVHYLASDLNGQVGAMAVWSDLAAWKNGVWNKAGDTATQPLPTPPATPIGGRYQPWGCNRQPIAMAVVDTNAYNLTFRDPLVWGPDNWSFPTNLLSDLSGLGQVHRGTPWQTLYLKAHDILKNTVKGVGTGTNTWVAWTGDLQRTDGQYRDAAIMAPVSDRRLADLLIALLDTNDIAQRFPVNNPNPADWMNVFDGVTVYSNSAAKPLPGNSPVFDTYTMSSNAITTALLANDIAAAKASQPDHSFYSVGDILAAPSLSEYSPWLNTNAVSKVYSQVNYGITDAAYEAIPVQLLLRLRPDGMGSLVATNGGWVLQFSGSDAFDYEVQSSTDLVHWQPVSTNQPVQGRWRQELPAPDAAPRFYRSVLVP